jgi:uncharacterized membrane protein (DUF2068 family)
MLIRKPLLTGVRTVAIFEAAKGGLVLAVGLGLLTLLNRDVEVIAEHLVRLSHLNPASRYPHIFLDAASHVTNGRLWAFAAAAGLYSIVRGIEAYGLWKELRWAEWFALISGGLYVPVEIYEMFHRFTWLKGAVLASNLAIVAYMAYALIHSEDQDRELEQPD